MTILRRGLYAFNDISLGGTNGKISKHIAVSNEGGYSKEKLDDSVRSALLVGTEALYSYHRIDDSIMEQQASFKLDHEIGNYALNTSVGMQKTLLDVDIHYPTSLITYISDDDVQRLRESYEYFDNDNTSIAACILEDVLYERLPLYTVVINEYNCADNISRLSMEIQTAIDKHITNNDSSLATITIGEVTSETTIDLPNTTAFHECTLAYLKELKDICNKQ